MKNARTKHDTDIAFTRADNSFVSLLAQFFPHDFRMYMMEVAQARKLIFSSLVRVSVIRNKPNIFFSRENQLNALVFVNILLFHMFQT